MTINDVIKLVDRFDVIDYINELDHRQHQAACFKILSV
jgi:hypothetical protein